MSIEAYEPEEQSESIIDLHLQGMSDLKISKETGLTRIEVKHIIAQWRAVAHNDAESRDAARDALHRAVEHYDRLILKNYELLDELKNLPFNHQVAGKKHDVIKAIADLEARKVDQLQKAGLYDNSQLGDELAQMERDKELVFDILRNDLCEVCRPHVMRRIGEASGRVEVVVVHDE